MYHVKDDDLSYGGILDMLSIRLETPADIDVIHCVNEQAFGRKDEADIVDKLRDRAALTLSLVAVQDNEVVGHIAFSPAAIESDSSSFEAISLGPIAVLPAYQRQGIGEQLVRAGLDECRKLGHGVVLLVGHPGYYPRFGFVLASSKGISCPFEVPDEAFMVLELQPGALADRSGLVRFPPELSGG